MTPATDTALGPLLFSAEELPASIVTELERREQEQGDWTAQRLRLHEPRLFLTICRMLGVDSLSQRGIAELCGVSEKTVRAVSLENPPSVTAFRDRMTVRRRNNMMRLTEQIGEWVEQGTKESVSRAYQAAIVLNIYDGQERLESGAPTQITRIEGVPGEDEYRRWLEARQIDDAVEVTGLSGGAALAKGGELEAGAGASAEVPAHCESVGFQSSEAGACDDARAVDQGGGGSRIYRGGCLHRLVSQDWIWGQSATDTPMDDPEPISEVELARRLGIARDVLAQARREALSDGDTTRKGNAILYHPRAVEKLRTHLHLPVVPVPEKKETPGPVTLTVVRLARLNRKIVFAAEKNGAPEIAVKVRDSGAFRPGQPVIVRFESPSVAYAYGPQPRWRSHLTAP